MVNNPSWTDTDEIERHFGQKAQQKQSSMLPSTDSLLSELNSIPFNQHQDPGQSSTPFGMQQTGKGSTPFGLTEENKQKPQNEQELTATENGQSELANLQRENQMMKKFIAQLLGETRPSIRKSSGHIKAFDEVSMGEMRKIYDAVVTTHGIWAKANIPQN